MLRVTQWTNHSKIETISTNLVLVNAYEIDVTRCTIYTTCYIRRHVRYATRYLFLGYAYYGSMSQYVDHKR